MIIGPGKGNFMHVRIVAALLIAGAAAGGALASTHEPGGKVPPRSLRRNHQVFPVAATPGFETGIVKLASIAGSLGSKGLMPAEPRVDWGDGSQPTPALFGNCSVVSKRTNCDVFGTHVYDAPGEYTITISFSLLAGGAQTLTTTATVSEASGLVVVSIGDSVASGEGNPVIPTSDEPAMWDDVPSDSPPYDVDGKQCHRSSLAGPALAAAQLEQIEDVTFIHLACSGGKISSLIDQLWTARRLLPRIDVLIMSGGANDIAGGFGNVITSCIDPRPSAACSSNQDFIDELDSSFAGLPDKYDDLDRAIRCMRLVNGIELPDERCSGEGQLPRLVVITEYFDPTRGRNGDFPGQILSTTCVGHTVAPVEWAFLYDHMVVPLNEAVAAAAAAHDWVLVTGIADAFRDHGYCASVGPGTQLGDGWVVKLPESVSTQNDLDEVQFPICFVQDSGCDGDIKGTGHPNLSGQEVYRDRILAALTQFNPPNTTAVASSGGEPYAFGMPSSDGVRVTLWARNGLSAAGVGRTYYAVDEPACTPAATARCDVYTRPFLIREPGRHTVTYFSENQFGYGPERGRTVDVVVEPSSRP